MITFTDLGRWSWLGNELFQYAALLGVGERLGYEVRLPPTAQHHLGALLELDTPTYTTAELRHLKYRFAQCYPYTAYDPELERIPDWCDVWGYFESSRHFPEEAELRRRYRLRADVSADAEAMWEALPHDRPVVGFHVRRGDTAVGTHWVHLGETEYYQQALDSFADLDPLFLLVSDDLEWCRENMQGDNAVVADAASAGVHLALLARCDHLILSNSTFSWWADWFHDPRGGRVVAPERWYSPGGFDDAARDRREHWIEI